MEQETHTPDLQHPDFSSGSTPAVHLQIQAALHELKRLTGVTLTLPAETPEDEEAALRQIRCLCTAYKEKYNKAQFLLSLMTDSVPSYDVAERALRLHIAPDENRILFLLESRSISDDTVLEILKKFSSPGTEQDLSDPRNGNTACGLKTASRFGNVKRIFRRSPTRS